MRVAINGFGRIGRIVFRLLEEEGIDIVAINDLTDAKQLAHLLKYDSNYGNYKINEISYSDNKMIVSNKEIKVFAEKDPANLSWKDLEIDVVFECTGHFTDLEGASKHVLAGAKKVVISAPAKGDVKTVVYNVNHEILDGSEKVVSAASCTTNCLAPVLKVLEDNFGIKKGYMTTVHAYTNDQVILDVAHKKEIEARRGRAGAINIIPSSTGAATAVGLVIPSLSGKLDGGSMRVPVAVGSVIDLSLELNRSVSVEEINNAFKTKVNDTLKFTMDPVVSSDIVNNTCGALVDGLLTNVLDTPSGQLVKVVAWYDNEMGYSSQMIKTAKYLMSKEKQTDMLL